MSDFLGHVVARSLELAPAVQPRLASLFEPTALAGAIAPGLGFESPEQAEAVPPPDPREAEPVPRRQRRRAVEPPAPARAAIPREDADWSALLPPRPAPVRPAMARPVEAREEEREKALGESLRRPASPDRAAPPGPESRKEDPPRLQPLLSPQAEMPRLPEPAPLQASNTRSDAADPLHHEAAGIRPVAPGRSPVPAPAAPGIVVRPHIERAAAPAPPPGIPEAAPTIHVTIGRIEVRATAPQAAAAPARRAPAPAAMTLDEYLRRRDGERR